MSSLEEDTELRDLLVQRLEANGTLNKIRAQLRASVFLALEEQQDGVYPKTPLENERLKHFVATDEGLVCANLVREFMAHFSMTPSLSIFDPECGLKEPVSRHAIAQRLGVEPESTDAPLLALLVRRLQQRDTAPVQQTTAVPLLNLAGVSTTAARTAASITKPRELSTASADVANGKRTNAAGVNADLSDDDFFVTSAPSTGLKFNLSNDTGSNLKSTPSVKTPAEGASLFDKSSALAGRDASVSQPKPSASASASALNDLPPVLNRKTLPPVSLSGGGLPSFTKSAVSVDVQRTKMNVPDKLFEDGAMGAAFHSDDENTPELSLVESLPTGGRQAEKTSVAKLSNGVTTHIPVSATNKAQSVVGFASTKNAPPLAKAPPATAAAKEPPPKHRTSTDDEVSEEIPEDIEADEIDLRD